MWIPLAVIVLAATTPARPTAYVPHSHQPLAISHEGVPSVDASKLTLSAPATIVEIDTGKLKGDPVRLSWSTDGKQMYLQTAEKDRSGAVKSIHHYLLALDGQPPQAVDEEPVWSARYWAWKSGQSAPGLMSFKIDIDQQRQRRSATAAPMGGDMAKGGVDAGTGAGGGTSPGDVMSAAAGAQMVNVYTLKLKGQVIGEFVNAPAVPGLTFGWAPIGSGLIAYANPDGRIVIMDDQGHKQQIASKGALLPAWTVNGTRLAYLEKSGKNKATLKIVDVKQPE
jgi:hypothetical protein